MVIKVKFDPQFSDMLLITGLVGQLCEIAKVVDPDRSAMIEQEITYRLRRMNKPEVVDENHVRSDK